MMRNKSVWQNILPLLKVSLKKICPTGLSMMSGRSEPMSRILISIRLLKEVSQDVLLSAGSSFERGALQRRIVDPPLL